MTAPRRPRCRGTTHLPGATTIRGSVDVIEALVRTVASTHHDDGAIDPMEEACEHANTRKTSDPPLFDSQLNRPKAASGTPTDITARFQPRTFIRSLGSPDIGNATLGRIRATDDHEGAVVSSDAHGTPSFPSGRTELLPLRKLCRDQERCSCEQYAQKAGGRQHSGCCVTLGANPLL